MTPSLLPVLRSRSIAVQSYNTSRSFYGSKIFRHSFTRYLHQSVYQQSRNRPRQSNPSNQNPSYPALNLDSLGLGKHMKLALIIILSIFGTIETWFWCKAIWEWRKGSKESQQNWAGTRLTGTMSQSDISFRYSRRQIWASRTIRGKQESSESHADPNAGILA